MTLELFENWACGKSLPLNFETYCRFVTEFREGELAVMKVEALYLKDSLKGLPQVEDLPQPDVMMPHASPAKTVTAAVDSVVNGTPVTLDEVTVMVNLAHPHLQATRLGVYSCLRQLTRREKLVKVGERAGVMFTRAAVGLCLCLLVGCSTPQFNNVTTASSKKINWYADVDWPRSESSNVKTYFVSYGLHPNTMTNELVTATNSCRVYGLELGRTYYFSVRASDGVRYSLRTDIATFKTP